MNTAHDTRRLENQIRGLLSTDPKRAIQLCEQLNRTSPDSGDGWFLTSQVAMRLNNPGMALVAVNKAIALEPENTGWLLQQALCYAGLSDMTSLDAAIERLSAHSMESSYQSSTMGSLLCQVNRHAEAVSHYEKAVAGKPLDAQHVYNLACLYRSLGRLAESEQCFDKTIALAPTDYESYKLRSELRAQKPDNNHVDELKKAAQGNIPDQRGQVQISFALAKELEDLGKTDESFRYLKQGADLRRSLMQYDVDRDLQTIEAIQNAYDSSMFDGHPGGCDSKEPIFILGMPRTGTTLVERVLSRHTDVYSAGELNNFSIQMMNQVRRNPADRTSLVEATKSLNFEELGLAYVKSTRPFTGHVPRFIDKLPLNYLYAGLIHLALPKAKIISLSRHPLDTCYSVYKQLFMDAYPFSYNLEELGKYYVAYHQLMAHWNSVMPGVIFNINYEDMVANLEE
jgi:tetratricopeptide (TPR) repeat protein